MNERARWLDFYTAASQGERPNQEKPKITDGQFYAAVKKYDLGLAEAFVLYSIIHANDIESVPRKSEKSYLYIKTMQSLTAALTGKKEASHQELRAVVENLEESTPDNISTLIKEGKLNSLSLQEMRVFELNVAGLSAKEIGRRLDNIETSTVNKYIKNIHEKLGVGSVGELCAIFYGKIDPERLKFLAAGDGRDYKKITTGQLRFLSEIMNSGMGASGIFKSTHTPEETSRSLFKELYRRLKVQGNTEEHPRGHYPALFATVHRLVERHEKQQAACALLRPQQDGSVQEARL